MEDTHPEMKFRHQKISYQEECFSFCSFIVSWDKSLSVQGPHGKAGVRLSRVSHRNVAFVFN